MTLGGGKRPRPGKLGKAPPPPGRSLEDAVPDLLPSLNLKKQPASGALPGRKGDLVGKIPGSFAVECKETTRKSYDLQIDTLAALVRAAKQGATPILILDFKSAGSVVSGGRVVPRRWVILPADRLEGILDLSPE